MAIYIELGALLVALVFLVMLLRFLKEPLLIIANSLFGLVSLFILNIFLHLGIEINIWSLLIIAFGGIPGLAVVLILHFLGLGF